MNFRFFSHSGISSVKALSSEARIQAQIIPLPVQLDSTPCGLDEAMRGGPGETEERETPGEELGLGKTQFPTRKGVRFKLV